MREKFFTSGAKISSENNIILQIHPEISLNHLKSSGQMLVDSDELAFVYLLENDDDYTYLVIKEEAWSELKKGIEAQEKVYVSNGTETMELIDFYDELNYLIENIKGNSNYGDAMVAKVEELF